MKKKLVIIYHPISEKKFTTDKETALNDSTVKLVDTLQCEPHGVYIGFMEDGKPETAAYVLMPYLLQMW